MPSPESRNGSACLKPGEMLRQTLKEGIWGTAETRLNLPVPQCPHVERKWTRPKEQLSSSPKKGPSTEVLFSLTDGRDKGTAGSSR